MTASGPSTRPGLIRRTLRKHWLGILGVWLVGSAVLTFAAYALVPPKFEAYSLFRVVPPTVQLDHYTGVGDESNSFLSTTANLITSPNVLSAAGANPKVASLPRIKTSGDVAQEIRKSISAIVIPQTYLIRVSMTSDEPSEAATIVNAVVEAFLKSNDEFTDSMSKNQIKSLDNYLNELKSQSDELEIRWKKLVTKGDVDNQLVQQFREGQPSVSVEQLKRLSDELFKIHIELIQAEAWAEALRADVKQAGPGADQERIEEQIKRRFALDPETAALQSKIAAAKAKYDHAHRITLRVGDPAESAAKAKLDSLKGEFKDLWASKYEGYRKQIVETTSVSSDQELREAESRVRSLKVKQAALKAESEKIKVSTGRSATDEVEIELLKEKRQSLKTMEETVTRRLEQLKWSSGHGSNVTQISKAAPPSKPISNQRPLLMLVIPFAMLFTAFGLFTGFEAGFGSKGSPSMGEPHAEG